MKFAEKMRLLVVYQGPSDGVHGLCSFMLQITFLQKEKLSKDEFEELKKIVDQYGKEEYNARKHIYRGA